MYICTYSRKKSRQGIIDFFLSTTSYECFIHCLNFPLFLLPFLFFSTFFFVVGSVGAKRRQENWTENSLWEKNYKEKLFSFHITANNKKKLFYQWRRILLQRLVFAFHWICCRDDFCIWDKKRVKKKHNQMFTK